MTTLYAIPTIPDPCRLHPRKLAPAPPWSERLDRDWLETQRAAHLAMERADQAVVITSRLVLALAQRLAVVEAQNAGLRQLRRPLLDAPLDILNGDTSGSTLEQPVADDGQLAPLGKCVDRGARDADRLGSSFDCHESFSHAAIVART